MAFVSRVGNLLKQSSIVRLSSSNSLLFQASRNMSSTKLFVGGLAYAIDEIRLRIAFQQFGEVTEARVIVDPDCGRSRGFGIVTYKSSDVANSALQDMNGKELHGKRIRVSIYQENYHPPSHGGGGGSYIAASGGDL